MENKDNVIASIKGKPNYIPKYITDRTMELMELYPNIRTEVHMENATLQFNRDKAVYDSIEVGKTKLYKRIVLFGDWVFESYSISRKFIQNSRFFVEAKSAWMNCTKEIDISNLLTEEEIKEEEQDGEI